MHEILEDARQHADAARHRRCVTAIDREFDMVRCGAFAVLDSIGGASTPFDVRARVFVGVPAHQRQSRRYGPERTQHVMRDTARESIEFMDLVIQQSSVLTEQSENDQADTCASQTAERFVRFTFSPVRSFHPRGAVRTSAGGLVQATTPDQRDTR